ncbi:MAG: adenylyltransferase/cytidyltransferase family protein [Puniceicoccales bacterium]|nr:adenylyltransferase/cytidyltransferase family protein [Puniceicoccales bacterium]
MEKFYSFHGACKVREELRKAGKRVVLTNGCFDLLHPGHMHMLRRGAKWGDSLWVALNSDSSVRSLKGPLRPIIDEKMRAYALESLQCVSGIFIFDESNVTAQITQFRPDVYVRAADRTLQDLDSRELRALREVGAHIEFLPFLSDFSTTKIVSSIVANYCGNHGKNGD